MSVNLQLLFGLFFCFLHSPVIQRNDCLIRRLNVCMAWQNGPKMTLLK